MLDGVGDVDALSVDTRRLESLIEQTSRRTDEWLSLDVFAVTGLLPDEHDGGVLGTFSKHGLRPRLVEIAGLAASSRIAQTGQGRLIRDQLLSRSLLPDWVRDQIEVRLLHLTRRTGRDPTTFCGAQAASLA